MCEVASGDERKNAREKALECYNKANEVKLNPACGVKLDIALGLSVYTSDILKNIEEAIKIGQKALTDASDKTEELEGDKLKESKFKLEVLKDNVQMWKSHLEDIKNFEEQKQLEQEMIE